MRKNEIRNEVQTKINLINNTSMDYNQVIDLLYNVSTKYDYSKLNNNGFVVVEKVNNIRYTIMFCLGEDKETLNYIVNFHNKHEEEMYNKLEKDSKKAKRILLERYYRLIQSGAKIIEPGLLEYDNRQWFCPETDLIENIKFERKEEKK